MRKYAITFMAAVIALTAASPVSAGSINSCMHGSWSSQSMFLGNWLQIPWFDHHGFQKCMNHSGDNHDYKKHDEGKKHHDNHKKDDKKHDDYAKKDHGYDDKKHHDDGKKHDKKKDHHDYGHDKKQY